MSPKHRFFGNLIIWCVSSLGPLWFATDAHSELFGFGSDIVFSPTVSALLMIPVILLFPCIYWCLAMRYGEEQAVIKCKKTSKVFIGLVGVFVVSSVIFSFTYTSILETKGYVKCTGRPDGWRGWLPSMYYHHRYVGSVIINKMFLPSGTSSVQFHLDNTIHSAIIEQK
jgi:hypothetical protein